MYSDDDPYLEDVRRICLSFPESVEIEAWGRPTFRAGKKIFAVFEGDDHHPFGLIFKPDPDDRRALLQDARFYSPRYWGPGGWLALDFTVSDVDWTEVAELVDSSYRHVALKRMIKELDARPDAPGSTRHEGTT
jgi:hypothetical protein